MRCVQGCPPLFRVGKGEGPSVVRRTEDVSLKWRKSFSTGPPFSAYETGGGVAWTKVGPLDKSCTDVDYQDNTILQYLHAYNTVVHLVQHQGSGRRLQGKISMTVRTV